MKRIPEFPFWTRRKPQKGSKAPDIQYGPYCYYCHSTIRNAMLTMCDWCLNGSVRVISYYNCTTDSWIRFLNLGDFATIYPIYKNTGFMLFLDTESTIEFKLKRSDIPMNIPARRSIDSNNHKISERIYTDIHTAHVYIWYPLIPKPDDESDGFDQDYDNDDNYHNCFGNLVEYYKIEYSIEFATVKDVANFIDSYPSEKANRRKLAFDEQISMMIKSGADQSTIERYTKKYHHMVEMDKYKFPYY